VIKLSTGDRFEYLIASGALGFDGRGWFWERPLVWLGLIRPELFAVALKTLKRHPTKGNLSWWKPWTWLPFSPWSCVRLIPGGAVNKVGLTNRGIEWWCEEVGPDINFLKYMIIGSILGNLEELVEMAEMLNRFNFAAIEINVSCPNADHETQTAAIIASVIAVKKVSRHPIILKTSCDQDYLAIAKGVVGYAEAIDLNSVPWKVAFPNGPETPLTKLEKKVGGGGGGVSGSPAQKFNWKVVEEIAKQGLIPVIASSIMKHGDIYSTRDYGASAFSFGTIHLPERWKPWTVFTNPCKATEIVENDIRLRPYREYAKMVWELSK
jgi:hypothetical protein